MARDFHTDNAGLSVGGRTGVRHVVIDLDEAQIEREARRFLGRGAVRRWSGGLAALNHIGSHDHDAFVAHLVATHPDRTTAPRAAVR